MRRPKRALSRYGQAIGAAFQVADDILDVEADEAALGKRAGKDADRNKATLVAALGLDAARERRDRLAQEAIAALDHFPEDEGADLEGGGAFRRRAQKLSPCARPRNPRPRYYSRPIRVVQARPRLFISMRLRNRDRLSVAARHGG